MGSVLTISRPEASLSDDLPRQLGVGVTSHRLNIVCVGAHPDDPETGCGGTLARLANEGHRVSIIYLTRGEAGIRQGDCTATALIRTAEAERGAKLLGAEAYFANQLDGQTSTDGDASRQFTGLLASLDPDVVFTHWPLDTHRDHRNAAQLTYEAWEALGEAFTLAYFEVMTGIQTHQFEPNCFIDISFSSEQKRAAVYSHACQNPDRFYPYHVKMEEERGSEARVKRAEAFVVVREKLTRPCLPFRM